MLTVACIYLKIGTINHDLTIWFTIYESINMLSVIINWCKLRPNTAAILENRYIHGIISFISFAYFVLYIYGNQLLFEESEHTGVIYYIVLVIMILSYIGNLFVCFFMCLLVAAIVQQQRRALDDMNGNDPNDSQFSGPTGGLDGNPSYMALFNRILNIFTMVQTNHQVVVDPTKLKLYKYSISDNIFVFDNECIVCMEAINECEDVRLFQCGHYFHIKCVDPWLKINGSCPTCRRPISDADYSPPPTNALTYSPV